MKKTILITGSSGFVGSRLAFFLKDKYNLFLPTHSELDVSCEEAVKQYMEEHCPEIVIHCAALSNTWYCEQHPEESHKYNVQGTVKVAKACKRIGARLIFMSSDQVYNGIPSSGANKEEDALQPVSIYGQHKLEAEQRKQRNFPDSIGLRLSWMYDLPGSRKRQHNNILVCLKKAYSEGSTIKVATHDFRGVTYVWELVRNIEKALSLPGGIYNYGSENTLDSHTLYIEAARLMGLGEPSDWILPNEEKYSEQPRNLTMDCTRIKKHGIYFLNTMDGMKEAMLRPYRAE